VISTGRRPGTQEGEMNMSWLSMIGGGITAAATLAVGISTSGILATNPTSVDVAPAAGETIYVEQPVIEVSATGAPIATSSVDPIVIAILPVPAAAGTSAASTPAATDPSVTPDPSMTAPPYEDGDDYLDYEDGVYEDEYEHEEEHEDEVEYEDEYEYDGGYEDEGPEEGYDD
jgi:hypothetical protein